MKYLDYTDASDHFEGTDWSGTTLPTGFCGMYHGETIALKTYHDKYVRAGGSAEGWILNQSASVGDWEKFVVVCDGEIGQPQSPAHRAGELERARDRTRSGRAWQSANAAVGGFY